MRGRRSLLYKLSLTLLAFTALLTLGFVLLFAEDFVVVEGPEGRFTLDLLRRIQRTLEALRPVLDDPSALKAQLEALVRSPGLGYAQVIRAGQVTAEANPLGIELPPLPSPSASSRQGTSLVRRLPTPQGSYFDVLVPLALEHSSLLLGLDPGVLRKVLQGRGSVTLTVTPAQAHALHARGYLRLGVPSVALARARLLRYGLSTLCFLGAFGVIWRFHRGLKGAILELQGAVRRFAAGDDGAQARLRTQDELQELGEAFNRMARALTERTRELERAHAAKTRFLATLSHELRTPLQAILGYGRLLQRGLGGPLPPPGERFVVGLLAAAQHLLALVENALQFVKLEAGEEGLHPMPLRLEALVEEARREVEALAREKGVQLIVRRRRGSDGTLYADRLKLERVLVNLLTNAVRAARGRVELRAILCKSWVVFAVRDDGPGVPDELRAVLFEPFQGQEGSGLGLGLAIVRRYVAMHGGRVRWRSCPGRGSRFAVAVPRSLPSPSAEFPQPRRPQGAGTGG